MNTTTNYRWFTSVHGILLPVNMKLIGIDFPWILKYCSRFTFNKWNESTTVITMEQNDWSDNNLITHYNDVIMGAMVSQISSLVIVYSTVCLFRRSSKKTSKLRVTGLCEGNSPVTGEFPAQMASDAENVSIWWRHHASTGTIQQCPLSLEEWEFSIRLHINTSTDTTAVLQPIGTHSSSSDFISRRNIHQWILAKSFVKHGHNCIPLVVAWECWRLIELATMHEMSADAYTVKSLM